MSAILSSVNPMTGLYFGLFYLYFWRAPPVVYMILVNKRPRAEARLVAFFVAF